MSKQEYGYIGALLVADCNASDPKSFSPADTNTEFSSVIIFGDIKMTFSMWMKGQSASTCLD